jgi:hypothetical protein
MFYFTNARNQILLTEEWKNNETVPPCKGLRKMSDNLVKCGCELNQDVLNSPSSF